MDVRRSVWREAWCCFVNPYTRIAKYTDIGRHLRLADTEHIHPQRLSGPQPETQSRTRPQMNSKRHTDTTDAKGRHGHVAVKSKSHGQIQMQLKTPVLSESHQLQLVLCAMAEFAWLAWWICLVLGSFKHHCISPSAPSLPSYLSPLYAATDPRSALPLEASRKRVIVMKATVTYISANRMYE